MNRAELEKWLGENQERAVALNEVAALLHVVVDASREAVVFSNADELRELRFAIAVLRDVFPSDDDVQRWLRAPMRALAGDAPATLLSAGRVREFVDLAVAEWNRPRISFTTRARQAAPRVTERR